MRRSTRQANRGALCRVTVAPNPRYWVALTRMTGIPKLLAFPLLQN